MMACRAACHKRDPVRARRGARAGSRDPSRTIRNNPNRSAWETPGARRSFSWNVGHDAGKATDAGREILSAMCGAADGPVHTLYRRLSTPQMTGISIALNTLEDKTFLLLVIAISLAFAWILWPFYGAVPLGNGLSNRLCAALSATLQVHAAAAQPSRLHYGRDHNGHCDPRRRSLARRLARHACDGVEPAPCLFRLLRHGSDLCPA